MTITPAQQTRHRRCAFGLFVAAALVFASSWGFLLWSLGEGGGRHLPAVLWVLTVNLTIVILIVAFWQLRKARPPADLQHD
ncbi:hypothetical protein [Corticibacter populi]|nr:hypothetical protein [Corticibacter populi]RZS30989.1 hypothetical protein EV687_3191 [Corticibacter populi]